MTGSNQAANLVQLLRCIPPKWALACIAAVLMYWLTQPVLNRSFGWNLPSIASMLGEAATTPEESSGSTKASKKGSSKLEEDTKSSTGSVSTERPSAATSKRDKAVVNELAEQAGVKGSVATKLNYLTEIGNDRYRSPKGLVYGRGSEEGHRLKHLERHLSDQPNRPGPHGVFDGDLPQVLRWIDEAYEKATQGDRMAKQKREADATIYEYTFGKPIGYIGGSVGKQRKNPSTNRLRLVVNGQNVITAFPF
jgi:hypothetical protein